MEAPHPRRTAGKRGGARKPVFYRESKRPDGTENCESGDFRRDRAAGRPAPCGPHWPGCCRSGRRRRCPCFQARRGGAQKGPARQGVESAGAVRCPESPALRRWWPVPQAVWRSGRPGAGAPRFAGGARAGC